MKDPWMSGRADLCLGGASHIHSVCRKEGLLAGLGIKIKTEETKITYRSNKKFCQLVFSYDIYKPGLYLKIVHKLNLQVSHDELESTPGVL
jgi:hypothetical protein